MADDISIQIDTRKLDEALAQLPIKVSTRYMRDALQAAGDVILQAVVALAPERTDEEMPGSNALAPGILKADLHTQVSVGTNGANVKVGPSDIAGHVCRWQNNGWNLTTHGRKRNPKVIKAIAGKHFLESGLDESGQKAVDAFVQSLADAIQAGKD